MNTQHTLALVLKPELCYDQPSSSEPVSLTVGEVPGTYRVGRDVTCEELVHLARLAVQTKLIKGMKFDRPFQVVEYLQAYLMGMEHEVFGVLCLDTQHRLISNDVLFRGTISSASVHVREVVKHALKHNAAAVMFYHNHPSGDCTPSDADKRITKQLTEALGFVDISVLDHIIVSHEDTTSFAQKGYI